MHDVAGNETRLLGQKKNAGISNYGAFRAVTEWMNLIQITFNRTGIRLFGAPFAEHGRPGGRGADGVYTNAVFRVIERHGFGQRIHAAFGSGIGGMGLLADDPNQTRCIQDAAVSLLERLQAKASGVENAFEVGVEHRIPFFLWARPLLISPFPVSMARSISSATMRTARFWL